MLDRVNIGVGVSISPAIETNSIFAMKQFAMQGHGVAVLPAISAETEIREGKLVYRPLVDTTIPQLRFSLLVRLDRKLTPAAELVIERLKARMKSLTILSDEVV